MKLRIARVEVTSAFGGGERLRWYAVQKRIGFFWWQTLAYCDSLSQSLHYAASQTKHPKNEVVLSIAVESQDADWFAK